MTELDSRTVLQTVDLGMHWPTIDPFLFCAHHNDAYPEGNGQFGPRASLAGRQIGADFAGVDGWNMYHGDAVPGFPQHPHRGFETVTYVRRGLIDHSDSLGAAARFGQGDTQWITAGKGIVHAEMFPLLETDQPNPAELFQIWLNLPAVDKMSDPHFTMLWSEQLPRIATGENGASAEITVIAGTLAGHMPPAPPPSSWASRADADVAIWHVRLDAHARCELPPAGPSSLRMLYFFDGDQLRVGDSTLGASTGALVRPDQTLVLEAGDRPAECLILQGRPIGEPVAQYGPFVMNTRAEIDQAFNDYRRTEFGGWPWPADHPVHGGKSQGRFARHADGRTEVAEVTVSA